LKNLNIKLKKESKAFDKIADKKKDLKFNPDLRTKNINHIFYNNPWRFPLTRKLSIKRKIDFVLRQCKENQKVVDVGCGLGTLAFELARKKIKVEAIDISKNSLSYARKIAKKSLTKKQFDLISFKETQIENYLKIIEDETIDRFIFFRTLHHLPDPYNLFKKIKKKLKKNGKIIIVEPFRSNINFLTGLIAYITRQLCKTWVDDKKKLNLKDIDDVDTDILKILKEYKYISEKKGYDQSPMDNITSNPDKVIFYLKKLFKIEKIETEDSFKDKIIGGIRGKNYSQVIKFIDLLDDYLIKKKIIKGTTFKIVAKK
jgi:2-polyprenyl-3-methyl-5-hydroxy-6-metoxy-1,4-benzoquinol methylase